VAAGRREYVSQVILFFRPTAKWALKLSNCEIEPLQRPTAVKLSHRAAKQLVEVMNGGREAVELLIQTSFDTILKFVCQGGTKARTEKQEIQ
jgi:hypothetical protein